jgi:cold shock CspA family protein
MTPATGPELVPVGNATLLGTVVEFDDPRGIGTVACGERSVPFHCTAITDGSRRIEVGTVVAVRIGAGRLGRLEARSVHPIPGVHAGPDEIVPDLDRPGAHSRTQIGDYTPVTPSSSAPPPSAIAEPAVEPGPAVEPDPVVEPGPAVEPDPVWPDDLSATPVSGTPAVPSAMAPPAPSPVGSGIEGSSEDDESAPRPNFWSPFSTSPAGPPPTWSTPVTPRVPPTDPA